MAKPQGLFVGAAGLEGISGLGWGQPGGQRLATRPTRKDTGAPLGLWEGLDCLETAFPRGLLGTCALCAAPTYGCQSAHVSLAGDPISPPGPPLQLQTLLLCEHLFLACPVPTLLFLA